MFDKYLWREKFWRGFFGNIKGPWIFSCPHPRRKYTNIWKLLLEAFQVSLVIIIVKVDFIADHKFTNHYYQPFCNNCYCWYREQGHRGQSKIVRGNRDFPTPEHWTWSSGQVKSVRKCNSCRDCSRHNVGYIHS